MIHGNSAWKEFFRDFGDALGGIGVGYAIATNSIIYGTIGTTLILTSIYLRFYKKKECN
jgi:hypothetical protein